MKNTVDFESYANDQISRQGTSSMKWEKYAGEDILPMWVADTDFKVADEITSALQQRVSHGIFGYTLVSGQLKSLILQRLQHLYQWQVTESSLLFLPGLVCGLNIATRAFTSPGDKVAVPRPIYPPFNSSTKNAGAEAVDVPMVKQQVGDKIRWTIDWPVLEQAAADIRLLMLCNPHNPGGTVFTRQELVRLADLAKTHDWLVCSDEIHCDLLLQNVEHIPFASISEDAANRCCTLMAPSKTWNIAGLGCSFAVIESPQLRKRFKQVMQGIVPEVNLLAVEAATAAYQSGEPWLQAQLDYLRDNHQSVSNAVNDMGLDMVTLEATYLAWIDASALDLSATEYETPAQLFEAFGVGLSPGSDFGCDKYVRLNFGCSKGTLNKALLRMKEAVTSLNNS